MYKKPDNVVDHLNKEICRYELLDSDENRWVCNVCEEEYVFFEGTPKDNHYVYCPYCGRVIIE